MSRIVPFEAAHLDQAAHLIARRQERLMSAEPALPAAYSDPATAHSILEARLGEEGSLGRVALGDGGEMTGFLLSFARLAGPWGRGQWLTLDGHAATDAETVRDLYADWAREPTAAGFVDHFVEVPAAESALLDGWYRLGFARMHEYGLREADPSDLALTSGVELRRATMDDRAIVEHLSTIINGVQAESPSFSPLTDDGRARETADYVEEIDGPDGWWLAVDAFDRKPLGMTIFWQPDPGPAVPTHAVYLGSTMVEPAARGRGVGRALLRFVLERGREAGAQYCVTNWRTANLLASRTWPALGFRTTHHRLHRRIER
ncbi:MAG TPA: GNAT family N-acetyltransferase [Candidatus Limnocylindria bacterium]|nr:GNAT family N-acetyltransferase [Candidatus Limnocylindria bacterium]